MRTWPTSVVVSLALAAAILGIQLAGTPARAAYPGANGRIAFTRSDGEGTDIYSIKPSGNRQRALVTRGTFPLDPVWAPSGRRLLYISGGATYGSELMIMRRNGNRKRRVVDVRGGAQDASWSPDGKRIVFSVARRRDQGDLYVVDPDGSDLRAIATDRAQDQLVSWSPTGDRIAVVRDNDIWTMDTSGEDRRRLTRDATECRSCGDRYGGFSGLDWAPGGRRLVFSMNRGDGASYVYTMSADGTDRNRVTEGMGPAWSPNGKRLVFARQARTYFGIFTIRPNGTGRYRVTRPPRLSNDSSPNWGPVPTSR